ncbi:MAG: hypothetical protein HND53_00250 [Proteobacteria bacterium]|nr:hypothetical protein [Pseudomonadota bacterium]NOG58905.1 hypothetical protein [Pseudomonadota bacterium]
MSRVLLTSFFLFTLGTQITFARNVYYFYKKNANISIEVNTAVKEPRKVYLFKDSEVIRKKSYEVSPEYFIDSSSLGMGSGYRNGDLNWNKGYANSATLPNVLSELEWDKMDIAQFSFNGDVRFRNNIRFGLDFGFGIISAGNNRDSDYLLDNRQAEFSRSIASVGGHDVIDVSTYLGYEFTPDLFQNYDSHFTPLIGYSYHAQNIQFEEGVQILSDFGFTVPLGPFSGVHDSEYRTNWYGPWLGFEFEIKKADWSVATRYSHHWVSYEADATWNLRTDFVQPKSFEHITDGEGDRVSLVLMRHWRSNWHAFLEFGMETWDTTSGIDRIFFANGNVSELTFNEANWDSWWAGIGVRRYF